MYLPIYDKKLIQISDSKPIYIIENDPHILVKIADYSDKIINEIKIQKKASNYVKCAKIINIIIENDKLYLLMEKIEGKTIYELFGTNPENIPNNIWKKIHKIISLLYYNNIHYIDISPYNFIVTEKDEIYIIDFGDAYECQVNWFLKDFLDGEKSWNPDFE